MTGLGLRKIMEITLIDWVWGFDSVPCIFLFCFSFFHTQVLEAWCRAADFRGTLWRSAACPPWKIIQEWNTEKNVERYEWKWIYSKYLFVNMNMIHWEECQHKRSCSYSGQTYTNYYWIANPKIRKGDSSNHETKWPSIWTIVKNNSSHFRQRSDTFHFNNSQAERSLKVIWVMWSTGCAIVQFRKI